MRQGFESTANIESNSSKSLDIITFLENLKQSEVSPKNIQEYNKVINKFRGYIKEHPGFSNQLINPEVKTQFERIVIDAINEALENKAEEMYNQLLDRLKIQIESDNISRI